VLWVKAHNDPRRRHDSQLRRGFGDPPCAPAGRNAERRDGLTQIELADKTGIDQGDISRIERGSIFPNEKTLLRFADVLGAEWRLIGKATT
jgi:DNA-binding XRE family transcriptional regulator